MLKEDYQSAEEYLKVVSKEDADTLELLEKIESLKGLQNRKDELVNEVFVRHASLGFSVGLALFFGIAMCYFIR